MVVAATLRGKAVDIERIKAAVLEIIEAIGEDPGRDGLADTPRRIAEAYAEIFSGLRRNPLEDLKVRFDEDHHEMVVLKDIPFYSLCEHHFLPFYGSAAVAYIPDGSIVGISKLARVVDTLSKRPQVQERLTSQIADTIVDALHPQGVAVVLRAEHLCMTMRGVKKAGADMVTSAVRGRFEESQVTRDEFMSLLQGAR
jgi:GTP cyclohydrolase I